MSTPRGRTVPVLLAALLLVGGLNVAAYAATGKPLLLGRPNAAGKPTTLENTGNGPALNLRSKPSAPSLKVSSTKKVARLNADRVDGLSGSELRTRTWSYAMPFGQPPGPATLQTVGFPGLPPGQYLATYTVSGNMAVTPDNFSCFFRLADDATVFGFTEGSIRAGDDAATATGVAVLDTGALGDATLRCNSDEPFFWNDVLASYHHVTFTRIDVSQRTAVAQ
jgi:hypothetical protein